MTLDDDAARVRAALDDLCKLAGVSPAESTPEAGRAVLAALPPGGEQSHPQLCALALWLRAATGITGAIGGAEPALAVTPFRVLVLGRREAGARERRNVDLPPAVRAAVRIADHPHLAGPRRLHRRKGAA